MAQIFVSHSSADNPLALRVRDCLGDLGYDSVFLDVSPTDGLVPGAAWRDQLFTNLDRSDALVFVGTPTANASLWCHSELALARWLRKPLLSLLFDDVDPHELVADIQGINLSSADLSSDVIRPGLVALGLEQAERWDATRSPFPGLRPFDESYAPVFFGRERQVDQLRQLVDPPSRARQGVVVPVLGPSGSGKSSLVRAGLVAALRPAPDWVVTEPWTPSDAPLAELALALSHAAKRHEAALDADECRTLLTTPGGMSEYLRRLRASGDVPAEARVLVVVDQAEELVTLTAEAERQAFLEALALSCTPPSPLRVVMTARTDMWDSVSALTNRVEMTVAPAVLHVPPLSRADLARVVAEPAKRSHLSLEDGLLQRLVEDTESGDALPLLAYTLQRMTALASDGHLTHALYDGVGGVRGAIASRAGEVAHGARSQAEVAAAILHIVGTGEGRPVTRLARLDTVPAPQREILDDLVDARLVVIRESAGHQVYAPAHEALFSAWPPLAEMIAHRHEDLRLRSRLERRAADWREGGGGASGLLSGDELDQAATWDERNPDLRTPDISAYVAASGRRARRNRLIRISVAAVVGLLALGLLGSLLRYADVSRRLAASARIGELRAVAQVQALQDPVASAIALLLALEDDPADRSTQEVARRLLAAPPRNVTDIGSTGVTALSAGTRLVGFAIEDRVELYDVMTGRLSRTIDDAGLVAVRADDRVAAAVSGQRVSTYDLAPETPELLATFGQSDGVPVFSPDGALLATTSSNVITVWSVADPAAPVALGAWRVRAGSPSGLAVLDDGTVLTVDDQQRLVAWPSLTGRKSRVVAQLASAETQGIVVDDAGGQALVSTATVAVSPDDGIPLVDLATSDVVRRYSARDTTTTFSQFGSVTWTGIQDRSGTYVAAFDISGRGYVFDKSGEPVSTLTGIGTSFVLTATFTRAGELVSVGTDGRMRTWDVAAAAATRSGSISEQLCDVFGARIDEASWRTVSGDESFDPPCDVAEEPTESPVEVSRQVEPIATRSVDLPRTLLDEPFDPQSTFPTGEGDLGSGTTVSRVVDGRYRMAVSGVGENFRVWHAVDVADAGTAFRLSGTATQLTGEGGCGVTVGDGTFRLTITVGADGAGVATWYRTGEEIVYEGESAFRVSAGDTHQVGVVADVGSLDVEIDGRAVIPLVDEDFGALRSAGVASYGDTIGCEFDDLLATTTR